MTDKLKFLIPALLAGFILVGCNQSADDGMPAAYDEMPAADEAMPAADDEMPAAETGTNEPGGYVPSADELVPGETRP